MRTTTTTTTAWTMIMTITMMTRIERSTEHSSKRKNIDKRWLLTKVVHNENG